MSHAAISRPKEKLASDYCIVFYHYQDFRLVEIIEWAEKLRDPTIVEHALECAQCRPHIKEREGFLTFSEMDVPLRAAKERIDQKLKR